MKKKISNFENIVTQIYLDASELEARLPTMVSTHVLTSSQASDISEWSLNLTKNAMDRVLFCFDDNDFPKKERNDRFQDLCMALQQYGAVLDKYVDIKQIRYFGEKLNKNIQPLALEYEAQGIGQNFEDRFSKPVEGYTL